jgi:antitoxin (DNA-binding transcriptional repressor) of toxin-antitoxin stability system
MEREMTVSEAARNFAEVAARVFSFGESARLIENGRVVARIVPVEDAGRPHTGAELAKRWTPQCSSRPRKGDWICGLLTGFSLATLNEEEFKRVPGLTLFTREKSTALLSMALPGERPVLQRRV